MLFYHDKTLLDKESLIEFLANAGQYAHKTSEDFESFLQVNEDRLDELESLFKYKGQTLYSVSGVFAVLEEGGLDPLCPVCLYPIVRVRQWDATNRVDIRILMPLAAMHFDPEYPVQRSFLQCHESCTKVGTLFTTFRRYSLKPLSTSELLKKNKELTNVIKRLVIYREFWERIEQRRFDVPLRFDPRGRT